MIGWIKFKHTLPRKHGNGYALCESHSLGYGQNRSLRGKIRFLLPEGNGYQTD